MLWAIVTCYTRIYVGVHYPGDLLFGTLVGFAAGAVTYGIYRFCLRIDGNHHLHGITHDCHIRRVQYLVENVIILDSATLAAANKTPRRGTL